MVSALCSLCSSASAADSMPGLSSRCHDRLQAPTQAAMAPRTVAAASGRRELEVEAVWQEQVGEVHVAMHCLLKS